MRHQSALRTFFLALLATAGACAIAVGQPGIAPAPHPIAPIVRPSAAPILVTPLPLATPQPIASAQPIHLPPIIGGKIGAQPPGTRIALARLPALPMRTQANSVTPTHRAIRPMAADGSTINVGTGAGCTGSAGDLFIVNCNLNWQASGLGGGDTFQDYYIASDSGVATSAGGGPYGAGGPPVETTQLVTAGIWVLAVFDVTQNVWQTVIYVNAGQPYTLKVYQDAFHTQEAYQFDANSSPAAYIYAQNLTPGDKYVIDVEETSVHPHCVFSAPAQGSYPTTGLGALCNPTSVTGIVSTNGTFAATWPLNSSYASGTYTVSIYDQSLVQSPNPNGQRLGSVQVALTGGVGIVLHYVADGTSANPSPVPQIATPVGTDTIAWDDGTEQSASGIYFTTSASMQSHNFVWSLNDPTGAVVDTGFPTGPGTLSHRFNFNGTILQAGQYAQKVYTGTLFDSTLGSVIASQSFEVDGYHVNPQFGKGLPELYSASITISPGGSTTEGLKFTNDAANLYGFGNGDPIRGFLYTTGNPNGGTGAFEAVAGSGNGIMASLNGFTLAQCDPSCSTVATDSNGSTWNVTDYCSNTGSNATGECYIQALPANNATALPAGGSLEIPSVTFYYDSGATCPSGTCDGLASILPRDGLTWSTTASQSAWNATYFTNGTNGHSAAASVTITGECNGGFCYESNGAEAHLYPLNFNQMAYTLNTPYTITNNHYNVYAVTIKNTSTVGGIAGVAFELPGPFAGPATLYNVGIDPLSTGNWRWVGCPASLPPGSFVCIGGKGFPPYHINPGITKTIYIDASTVSQSFTYLDVGLLSFPYNGVGFQFGIGAAANNAVFAAGVGGQTVDSLATALYSLNGNLMSAAFSPATAGQNIPTLDESVVFTNASLSSDPNPDYVDAIILRVPNTYTLLTPTTSGATGWGYQAASWVDGANNDFLFGLCAGQNTAGSATPPPIPVTSVPNAVPKCASTEPDALAPGQNVNLNLQIQGVGTSSPTFQVSAHGANGGGWTPYISLTLPTYPTAASGGFSSIDGNAVPTNTEPQISTNSNTYLYILKNTSATTAITGFTTTLPGTDVSGLSASQLGVLPWNVTASSISGTTYGCSITSTTQPTSGGGNGSLVIGGGSCSIPVNSTITVQFTATSPAVQNDEFDFPTSVNPGGAPMGANWLGDTRVKVVDMIGLSVIVDPSDPGPGGSTPTVSCPGCAFSGTTIDFGNATPNTQTQYGDVVRASIYAQSSGFSTWTLCMDTNNNPTSTHVGETNELQLSVDSANSTTGVVGLSYFNTAFATMPVIGSGNPQLKLAYGPFNPARSSPYDVIQNLQLSVGTETPATTTSQLTYTVIEDNANCPAS